MRRTPHTFAAAGLALTVILLAALIGAAGPASGKKKKGPHGTKVVTAQKTFSVSGKDSTPRLEVYCPRGTRPLGGGAYANPPIERDGSGIYPDSSERLGQQNGWHVTVSNIGDGQTHQVTL